jgi:predicted alpha/beta superfamily hydrolase
MSRPSLPAHCPATLHRSIQFDINSLITGRTYRVFVFEPDCPPPPSGHPVVVGLDGNMVFPIMATVSASFALTGNAALIVCVGYPTDDPRSLFSLRSRDLTPPTPLEDLPQKSGQPPPKPEDYGGAEEFYRFLTGELRPLIAAAYPVDANNQTLYGHSIAGLFTLGLLFGHPASFRNFAISSPAIWWNKRSVLSHVPDFIREVEAGEVTSRILIMVGAKEQDLPAKLPPVVTGALAKKLPWAPSPIRTLIGRAGYKKMMLDWRMVDNALDLAAQLQGVKGASGYSVSSYAFEGEDHLTVLPGSIARTLAFVVNA